ncbi:hypothetical protein AB4144_55480, partial [Rhizobiaceae sp. 2RAB30]
MPGRPIDALVDLRGQLTDARAEAKKLEGELKEAVESRERATKLLDEQATELGRLATLNDAAERMLDERRDEVGRLAEARDVAFRLLDGHQAE